MNKTNKIKGQFTILLVFSSLTDHEASHYPATGYQHTGCLGCELTSSGIIRGRQEKTGANIRRTFTI